MRIVNVFCNFADKSKGPANSVPLLAESLLARGHLVELWGNKIGQDVPGGMVAREFPAVRSFGMGRGMRLAMQHECRTIDIVHTHSFWTYSASIGLFVPKGVSTAVVVSPRGTLSTWALKRSRIKKGLAWTLYARRALYRADMVHVTAHSEMEEVRRAGYRGPICIVPNVVKMPQAVMPKTKSSGPIEFLFLSRLHPKKGLEFLLRVWAEIEGAVDARLQIVGPDNGGYLSKLKGLSQALGLRHVEFRGELLGPDKEAAFRSADVFLLPTHSDNFANVVAEAMSYALPVIVSTGAPWEIVEHEKCGSWLPLDAEVWATTIKKYARMSREELAVMGEIGSKVASLRFASDSVGMAMEESYRWLQSKGGAPPEYVCMK